MNKDKKNMRKKLASSIISSLLIVIMLSMPSAMAVPTVIYLSWTGTVTQTDIGGAIWEHFPSTNASGTGVFDTYLAVDAKGIERGLNHNGSVDFNEQDSKTSSLPLSSVPLVQIGGVGIWYREFVVDVNQAPKGDKHLLSTEKADAKCF